MGVISILVIPVMLVMFILQSFWKVFGATVISFILIGLFGGTLEECITYAASLGFFVAIILKVIEKK